MVSFNLFATTWSEDVHVSVNFQFINVVEGYTLLIHVAWFIIGEADGPTKTLGIKKILV